MKRYLNTITVNKKYILVLFLSLILASICIADIKELNQYIVMNDEFGYWSIAAYLAKKDWTDLIAYTPYYSYGYSVFILPIFAFFSNPSIMYGVAIMLNIALICASFILSVYCCEHFFHDINHYVVVICCFVGSLYSNTLLQTQVAWTETLLYFLFWTTVALLISYLYRPKCWKIIVWCMVLVYMYSVHQRTVSILIAAVICIFIMLYEQKMKKKHFLTLFIVSVILIVIQVALKTEIKSVLWQNPTMAAFNDYGGQVENIQSLFSVEGVKLGVKNLIGRGFYFLLAGGIPFFCGILYLVKTIFERITIDKTRITNKDRLRFIVNSYIMLSFLGCVAIAIISMLTPSRLESLVYGRYIENTIGPILTWGLLKLYDKRHLLKINCVYVVATIISGVFIRQWISYVESELFNSISSPGLGAFFIEYGRDEFVFRAIFSAIIISTVICFMMSLKRSERIKSFLFIIVLIIIGSKWVSTAKIVNEDVVLSMQKDINEQLDPIVKVLKDYNIESINYIYDSEKSPYCWNAKYLQFQMPDLKIDVIDSIDHDSMEIYDENEIVLLESRSNTEDILKEGYALVAKTNYLQLYVGINNPMIKESDIKGLTLDVNSFESENRNWDVTECYQSSGEAGYLTYGSPIELKKGKYKVSMEVELLKEIGVSELGSLSIVKDEGNIELAEKPVFKNMFRDNKTRIEAVFECKDTKDIEIKFYCNQNVIMSVNNVAVKKILNEYNVGVDSKESICKVIDRIEKQSNGFSVNYLYQEKYMKYKFDYFETKSNTIIKALSVKKALEELPQGYLLIDDFNIDIFSFMKQYDVIYRDSDYALLIRKDVTQTMENSIENEQLFSQDLYLNSNYFRVGTDNIYDLNQEFMLELGIYEFKIPIQALKEQDKDFSGYIDFTSSRWNKRVEVDSSMDDVKIEVPVEDNKQYVNVSFRIQGLEKIPQVWIKRVSKDYLFNLSEFDLQNAELYNGIIKSNGKEGSLYDNLGFSLQEGKYNISFYLSQENPTNLDKIGTVSIYSFEHEIIKQELNLKQFVNGKCEITLPLQVGESGLLGINFDVFVNDGVSLSLERLSYNKK